MLGAKKPPGTQAGPTPQWAPGPAHAPPGGLPPPAARLPGPAVCPLGELELGNTTFGRICTARMRKRTGTIYGIAKRYVCERRPCEKREGGFDKKLLVFAALALML